MARIHRIDNTSMCSELLRCSRKKKMMIAFITFNISLVPLIIMIEGLWSSNPWGFKFSGFRRNWTNDLGINSLSLWPTEPRLHVRDIVRHASHCLLRIYRDLLRIHRALLRIYRALTWGILWGMPAIVFCGYTGLFCKFADLQDSWTDIQGSFADIQGSFADIQSSLADVQGSYTED